jgi:hypothetical protein
MRNPFTKAPSDVDFWGVNWTNELEDDESIVTSSWVIVTQSSTIEVVNAYVVDKKTVVWLSGGDLGERTTINNFISTDSQPVTRHLSRQLLFWIEGAAA